MGEKASVEMSESPCGRGNWVLTTYLQRHELVTFTAPECLLMPIPPPNLQILDHPSALHLVSFPPLHRRHPSRFAILHVGESNLLDSNGLKLLVIPPTDSIGWDDLEVEEDRRGQGIDELEC